MPQTHQAEADTPLWAHFVSQRNLADFLISLLGRHSASPVSVDVYPGARSEGASPNPSWPLRWTAAAFDGPSENR